MDVLVCLSLTAIELVAADIFHLRTLSPLFIPGYGLGGAVFLAQYFVLKFYRIFLYPKFFSPLRHLPGPGKSHFLLGQTLNIYRSETPTSIYVEWMKQHPEAHFIRYLGFLNKEILVPNSVAAHKAVLQTNCYSFTKPGWFLRLAKEIAGHGILFMEGAEHRAHRKMLTNSFSLKSIRKLEPVFREKSKDICGVLHQVIARNGGKSGVFNCGDIFMKAILDIVGPVILGVNLDYVKPADNFGDSKEDADQEKSDLLQRGCTFHEAYGQFFAPTGLGKLLLFANGFFPVRWLPLQANRDFAFAMNWLNSTILNLIRQRYRAVAEAKEDGTYESAESQDLLTFIAEEGGPGGATEGLDEMDLLGHLLELMAAGHDTTANMLSWSCYIMATRHDVQDALRRELQTLSPDAGFPELDRLPYLDGFVKESLRLYPPASKMQRKANEPVNVEGIHIPKETEIDLCPTVVLHNPLVWGEDVEDVDPTRWSRLKGAQSSPYVFTAFSNGPRVCLGKLFALVEIKILLAEVVRNFRFTEVVKAGKVESPSFTLRPAGLEVRIQAV